MFLTIGAERSQRIQEDKFEGFEFLRAFKTSSNNRCMNFSVY